MWSWKSTLVPKHQADLSCQKWRKKWNIWDFKKWQHIQIKYICVCCAHMCTHTHTHSHRHIHAFTSLSRTYGLADFYAKPYVSVWHHMAHIWWKLSSPVVCFFVTYHLTPMSENSISSRRKKRNAIIIPLQFVLGAWKIRKIGGNIQKFTS